MRIYTKAIRSMTEAEYEAAYKLNMGNRGMMRGQLQRCREDCVASRAVLAVDDDGKLIGWALKFRYGNVWDLYVYVNKAHRSRGIGRKLVARARMGQRSALRVYPTATSRTLYAPLKNQGRVVYASGRW